MFLWNSLRDAVTAVAALGCCSVLACSSGRTELVATVDVSGLRAQAAALTASTTAQDSAASSLVVTESALEPAAPVSSEEQGPDAGIETEPDVDAPATP